MEGRKACANCRLHPIRPSLLIGKIASVSHTRSVTHLVTFPLRRPARDSGAPIIVREWCTSTARWCNSHPPAAVPRMRQLCLVDAKLADGRVFATYFKRVWSVDVRRVKLEIRLMVRVELSIPLNCLQVTCI